MPGASEQAIAQARRLLSLPQSPEGRAWRVRRLDGQNAYFLVHVAGSVACIDAAGGELLASAAAANTPVSVTSEAALALAGLGDTAAAELVWKPCAATLSMFDPLWSVTHEGREVFVDQRRKVWRTLPPKSPGGGAG
ncbi:hypothetical protein G5V57_02810 [Nordella sp. HKS 07]|uniref:hypothetical protein n=1 Tax=Nordella sp. HKS 07 TaxID=2712222 RepID=UPI0013E19880|nr:hypothetical protein [Nordella sp. HKS 07]QIG46774.1 hypothetical protein G5V57_02810 [Nordella sp. HKS 07]